MSNSPSIQQALLSVQTKDYPKLSGIWHRLYKTQSETTDHPDFLEYKHQVARSQAITENRQKNVPVITYPDLPVSTYVDEIKQALSTHKVIIIAGETGSGKSTQLPKICLDIGLGTRGLIGHTQPRRIAARAIAHRLSDETNMPIGQGVGFKIRFSDHTSEQTYIKVMTDGILLAEIEKDKKLSRNEVIIIDEAHERSLNIDFLLGNYIRL